jgi:ABC-type uncharacterized transport system involved in gliding motility auxiliary subunit
MSQKKTQSGLTLLVLAVLFIGVVMLTNALFRGLQVDLTPNNQYTLSKGTREIVGALSEPITLRMYFSQQASEGLPQYRAYAQRVRELIEQMVNRSGGKLSLQVIDPQPFSEAEDEAAAYGISALPVSSSGEKLMFGLAASNSTNQTGQIPFFDLSKETFLEYDIAKLIESLNKVEKNIVGVISSLPMSGGFDQATRQMSQGFAIYSQLSEMFEMRPLPLDTKNIDPQIKLLMLVHPKELSDDLLYAIDQFVLRGGRLAVFVDPNASTEQNPQSDPNNPMADMFTAKSSNLPKLFDTWKVKFNPDQVVGDRLTGLELQFDQNSAPTRSPVIMRLTKDQMNQSDIISAELENIILDTVGQFKLADGADKEGVTLEPLLQSSSESTLIEAERVRFSQNPAELFNGFAPTGENYLIAGVLSGKFKSAFPDRASTSPEHVAEAKEPARIVLVADTDILTDRTWVQVQSFLGQKIYNQFANNGEFVSNIVDKLAGSEALITVRARGNSQRSFEYVDGLKRKAEERFQDTERKLQDELRQAEQKLTELQQNKSADQAMILSSEQQAEILRFQKRKLEIRKELRQVQSQLNSDVQALGRNVKVLNILIIPILMAILGLWFFSRRSQMRRAQVNSSTPARVGASA